MIDISLNIDELITQYPGSSNYSRFQNTINSTSINLDSHFGTHIDAPSHFIKNGKTIEELDSDLFVGLTTISKDLPNIVTTDRIFFRFNDLLHKNESFNKNYKALGKYEVEWVLDNKIKVVGIDYLSIEPYLSNYRTHEILLKNDVLIIEGLNLFNVKEGIYQYYAFPIRSNGEGSPARVMLDYV